MKFNFKIQPFQTEAVSSVIGVFNGQLKQDRAACRHDVGAITSAELQFDDDTGYRNAAVELDDAQLLKNIRQIQTEGNIKLSPSLVKEFGAVSLD